MANSDLSLCSGCGIQSASLDTRSHPCGNAVWRRSAQKDMLCSVLCIFMPKWRKKSPVWIRKLSVELCSIYVSSRFFFFSFFFKFWVRKLTMQWRLCSCNGCDVRQEKASSKLLWDNFPLVLCTQGKGQYWPGIVNALYSFGQISTHKVLMLHQRGIRPHITIYKH